ncbi:MAG: NADH-quinone oxidoreductase subunit C [candidate division Zixibacteria bacterium]|nr:NADH-quinone oxidoreductase subunit C [candidate division Zixibacteria bacterium]
MSPEEIKKILTEKFPDKLKEAKILGFEPTFVVEKDSLLDVCLFVKESKELSFDLLSCMSGADYPDRFEMVYLLFSFSNKHKMSLKVQLPKDNPEVESVTAVWKGADWYERETAELYGIKFKNHPDLRPLLLPEDWNEGYPLRKDWTGKDFLKLPDIK